MTPIEEVIANQADLPEGHARVELQDILIGHYVVIDTEKMTRKWSKMFTSSTDEDGIFRGVAEILVSTDLKYGTTFEDLVEVWPLKKFNQAAKDILEYVSGPKEQSLLTSNDSSSPKEGLVQ